MQTVACDADIQLPEWARCPICGEKLVLEEITGWDQLDDGTWQASECEVSISCTTEPEIDSDEWDDWWDGHYQMPYVDWLPLEMKIHRWLNKNYRFDVDREGADDGR